MAGAAEPEARAAWSSRAFRRSAEDSVTCWGAAEEDIVGGGGGGGEGGRGWVGGAGGRRVRGGGDGTGGRAEHRRSLGVLLSHVPREGGV